MKVLMKAFTKSAALVVAVLAFSAVAFGATPGWPSFDQVDKDRSGSLDTKEAGAIKGLDFKAVDANRDGVISKPEYETSMLKSGKSGGAGGAAGAQPY
jgi:hypothetical protein